MYKVIRLLEKVPRGVFQEQIVWRETRTISRDTDTLYLDVSTSPGSSQRGLVHSTDRVKGPTGIFSGRWIQGVYIVEFYNQVSDCSIQDSHQSVRVVCNFKCLLDTIKLRRRLARGKLTEQRRIIRSLCQFSWKKWVGSQGFVIRVCSHTHNEPGHGSDQCDSCGANCVRACYAWNIKHGIPINHARQTVSALQSSTGLKGMIHVLTSHDPNEKLNPSRIPNLPLGTRHCLHKSYRYLNDKGSLI